MAVAEPIASHDAAGRVDEDRNVVWLVDLMGPISPELVLVDPQLAAHARALLPDNSVARQPQWREPVRPAPVPRSSAPAGPSARWKLLGICAAVAAVISAGLGAWAMVAGNDPVPSSQPTVETEPSVETETGPTFFSTPPAEPDLSPEALAALEEGVRLQPRSALVREALGGAYIRLERWEDAEAEFRVLVELSPKDDFAHYALGRTLREQGRESEAAREFEVADALADGGTSSAP